MISRTLFAALGALALALPTVPAQAQSDLSFDSYVQLLMARARAEISHWDAYDYVVINEDVDSCFDKVSEILDAERMKRQRQTGLIPFVRELMN